MEHLNMEDLQEPVEITEDNLEASASDANELQENEQDAVKQELERLRPKRTQEEKLEYNIRRMQEELNKIKGVEEPDTDDDVPLTLSMYKKMQAMNAQQTALDLANSVQDEAERELIKFHIENTIKPSGDAQEDLSRARTLANAVKNSKILEMESRRITPKSFSGSSGAPGNAPKEHITLTAEEAELKRVGNLTDDDIIFARKHYRPE